MNILDPDENNETLVAIFGIIAITVIVVYGISKGAEMTDPTVIVSFAGLGGGISGIVGYMFGKAKGKAEAEKQEE